MRKSLDSRAVDGLEGPIVTRSVASEIQQKLLRLLNDRELLEGSQLPPERELAESLSVSRTTLRDALRGLADRGLLRSRQGSGWFVEVNTKAVIDDMTLHFRLSDMTLDQLKEARLIVEPSVAAMVASRRTTEENDALQSLIGKMDRAKSAQTFLSLVDRFHEILVEACHNQYFGMSVMPLLQLLFESRVSPPAGWSWQPSLIEHRRIATAIDKSDPDEAFQAMHDHITRAFGPTGVRSLT